MNATIELFSKLDDYFDRRINLRELETWLAPRIPMFLDAPDSVVGRITGAIELTFAEVQSGMRNERSARTALSRYHTMQRITWLKDTNKTSAVSTSSAATQSIPVVGLLSQLQIWNNEPVTASE